MPKPVRCLDCDGYLDDPADFTNCRAGGHRPTTLAELVASDLVEKLTDRGLCTIGVVEPWIRREILGELAWLAQARLDEADEDEGP